MEDYFEIVRQVLIPVLYKETMLGRSLRVENPKFKKEVFDSCLELARASENHEQTAQAPVQRRVD